MLGKLKIVSFLKLEAARSENQRVRQSHLINLSSLTSRSNALLQQPVDQCTMLPQGVHPFLSVFGQPPQIFLSAVDDGPFTCLLGDYN